MMKRNLQGKTIVVTRDPEQAGPFMDAIRRSGGIPCAFPTIRIKPVEDLGPFADSLSSLRKGDWIVFSSTNAVRFTIPVLREYHPFGKNVRIAAVGPKTGKALEDSGFKVDLIAKPHTAAGLIDAFKKVEVKDLKFLLPQASIARDDLAEGLESLGAIVIRAVVYHTVPNRGQDAQELLKEMEKDNIDCITFFSPSSFHSFIELLPREGLNACNTTKLALASIGPTTSQAIRDAGFSVALEAEESTAESLLDAISEFFMTEPSRE